MKTFDLKYSYPILFLLLICISALNAYEAADPAQPDTTIYYFADQIDYDASSKKIYLTGNSRLKYKKMDFFAHSIILNIKENTLKAFQKEDTLFSGEEGSVPDSIVITGTPVISEGSESVKGSRMFYDLNTKQGVVSDARTVLKSSRPEDDTFFRTEDMIKLENNDVHGINARITSCDLKDPHYHFKADSIIMTRKNWVFAKPITLYFSKVPVAWFPFILYKNNKGRNSGFILPSYYYSNSKGNSLKHLGFFWDMSDYTDYTVLMDYYDNYGYLLQQKFRYKKKYVLDGYVSADFTNDYKSHDWRFRGVHNHKISPSMSFNANADYVTKRSMVRDLGETRADRMENKLYTNGVFTKRWFNTGDNLRIMSSVTQYVDTAIVKYTFPDLSYRMGGRRFFSDSDLPSIFKKFQLDGSLRSRRNVNVYDAENVFDENSSVDFNLSQKTEYGNLRFKSSQRFDLKDHKSKYYYTDSGEDHYEHYNRDSTLTNFGLKTASYIQYNHTLFRHLDLRETINYRHDTAFRYYDEDLNIVTGARSRETYDISAGLNTKIYGIFQPELWALRKLRHTISPNFGFTYYPDFSKDKYGYFITDSLDIKRDVFSPSLIGATPSGESMSLNYGISNIFEAKIKLGDRDKLIRLFNLNFSGFYNFAADSNKMSVINARLSSNLYNGSLIGSYVRMNVSMNANSVFTPYTGDGASGDYINSDFTFWEKNPFRREKWNISYTVELPYSLRGILSAQNAADTESVSYDEQGMVDVTKGNYTNINYDINGRVVFKERYDSNDNYRKDFHGSIGARINPTENWSVDYRATFNMLMPKEVTSTIISVNRDMHCWQGSFEWDYFNKGFKLLINTKSSIFSDIKFDKDTRERKW
ncbi:MAG: putative LPS assembly protein LptD [Candidatus Delongbacteria bacterium]